MDGAARRIAVAVVLDRGRVLVGLRSPDAADAPSLHEFPGGKVESREAPAAAAQREVREETGLEVTIGPLLDKASAVSRSGPIEIIFLAAQPVDTSAVPLPPFEWVPIDRLAELTFPAANRRVLERIWQETTRSCHGGS